MNDTSDTPKKNGPKASGFMTEFFGPNFSKVFSSTLLARSGLIAAIALALYIPLGMVKSVIEEREHLYRAAKQEIAASWGIDQTISGPVLVIPYEVWEDRAEAVKEQVMRMINGTPQEVTETRHITRRHYILRHKIVLPAQVAFEAGLDTETRYRGIHRQVVYAAPVAIRGNFALPDVSAFEPRLHEIHWEKAWLAIGVTDPKTIAETAPLMWEGTPVPEYRPGTGVERILGLGFHAPVPLTDQAANTEQAFSLSLKIRGSGGISFTPVGEHTDIRVTSPWPDPSFRGNLLPMERQISPEGFTAQWTISNLTRSYPQIGDLVGDAFLAPRSILDFTAGVDLQETVSLYRMNMRATHYAILFIAATFAVLFAFEMAIRQRMHLLQYGMVGLSLSLFYLVLLSLAEHIDFRQAFTAAAAITVIMNSLYVAAVLRSKTRGLLMAVLLAVLYALLFSLLRMEDFALLAGTTLVVAIMGVLMFFTRRLPQAPVPVEQ